MVRAFSQFFASRIYPIFFLFLLIIPADVNGQSDALNAHPAIWMIESGASKTYLLGSVHLLPDGVNWYGELIKEVVQDADEIVFEVNMTPEKIAQSRSITLANGMLEKDDLLSNYLEVDEYSYLIEIATASGIPVASIAGFKPWFASIVLSVSAVIKEGWSPESGVDKFIEGLANERAVKISSLETLEAQMKTLYDHPLDVQASMLKDTLVQLKDIKALTLEMVNSWAAGDTDKMSEVFLEPMMEQPEIFEKLVTSRNNNWVPVIESLIAKNQTTLIVAGTAHFIGQGGVINLLRQKGYDVRRVQ